MNKPSVDNGGVIILPRDCFSEWQESGSRMW